MQRVQQMKRKDVYTASDCEQLRSNVNLKNKVVILSPFAFEQEQEGTENLPKPQKRGSDLTSEKITSDPFPLPCADQAKGQLFFCLDDRADNANIDIDNSNDDYSGNHRISTNITAKASANANAISSNHDNSSKGNSDSDSNDSNNNNNNDRNGGNLVTLNNGNKDKDVVPLISLLTGEWHLYDRQAILGTIKPELLPEDAKLQLSQIRPERRESQEGHDESQYERKRESESKHEIKYGSEKERKSADRNHAEVEETAYFGYAFLPDGRYATAVPLDSVSAVIAYIAMQKPYQHRLLICDQNGFAAIEVVEGKMIFVNAH